MAKKLSQKKLDQLFKVWVERQSVNFVAKKCKVSHTTVEKYRKQHRWDERLTEIQRKAQDKQDDSLASLLAENLKFVRYAKGRVVQLMRAGGRVSNTPISDLDRMIRLELLLSGQADQRPEIVDQSLRNMTTAELLKLRATFEKCRPSRK